MTKTLTEQWREGTLTGGFYYIQLKDERWPLIDHTDYNLLSHKIEWKDFDWRAVEEVIDEVPSYEEYKQLVSNSDESSRKALQLEKKLEIATKALKDVSLSLWDEMECRSCAKEALKEMEGVK